MEKTPIEKFDASINRILKRYADDLSENVDQIAISLGRRGANELRAGSAIDFGGTGKYARGWTSTVEQKRTGAIVTIHNANVPGLPHLLEHGHANRGGGRTPGRYHIGYVEQLIAEAFEREVVSKL